MQKPESEPICPSMKEEARIRTGIEADPGTLELDDEWFAKARPASEAHPRIVERYRRRHSKQRVPTMAERKNLLASIASTIKDYRAGEIPEPTQDHVDQWIDQFDPEVQIPMLRELDYVFRQMYVSQSAMRQFLTDDVAGRFPCEFWQSTHILSIQKKGKSQSEIRELFGEILKEKYGHDIDSHESKYDHFIYLDDAIFTGDHVMGDLANIIREIPQETQLRIIVIAIHSYAEYNVRRRFSVSVQSKWRFENRQTWHNEEGGLEPTDVLRPSEIGKRNQNERKSRFFSSVEGRQLLEREFLSAGEKIRGFAEKPDPNLKPLGYNTFEPGFGSLFVTYRNCPNNCPLPLWYGDPSYPPAHPLGRWYPLFPRKTYHQ